jgi:hypothetical protein
MRDIVMLAGADDDLQEIFNRLEDREDGRGREFMAAVDRRLAWLSDFADSRSFYREPFRKERIPDTMQAIFYTSESRGVMVHAILDLRQDPRAIHRRLFGREPDGPTNMPSV